MSESLIINNDASIDEQYQLLVKQIKSLLRKGDNLITNLSNFTAALKQTFNKISWVGFYLFDGTKLYLGPFQGKVACTEIQIGSGVCGTSAQKRETIIVADVDKFPGHIACDVESAIRFASAACSSALGPQAIMPSMAVPNKIPIDFFICLVFGFKNLRANI